MDESLFLSEQHPTSLRWVILEDDEQSAWMYLTEPDETRPVSSCWLYNRIPAPTEASFGRGDPPVVPATHTQSVAAFSPPLANDVTFRWATSGIAVAVYFGEVLIGFISGPACRGFSKNLRLGGPFGAPFDAALFKELFGPN